MYKEIAMRKRISLIAFAAVISIVFANQCVLAEDANAQKGKEKAMSVQLQWFGHASFKITEGNTIIYIDPWKLKEAKHDASVVLISHSHFDHYSADDIKKVSGPQTRVIGAGDVIKKAG